MFLTPMGIDLVGDKKIVCMSFSSTGYPDVKYDMYYGFNESTYIPITNQSCLEHSVVRKDVSIIIIQVHSCQCGCACVRVCMCMCVCCACVHVYVL